QRPHRVLRCAGGTAGQRRPADPPVPRRPAGRAHSVRQPPVRQRRDPQRGGRLMQALIGTLVAATRSLGRAGLFSLSVLRASKPTRDFFAELVREIYKIGARSLPIIAIRGAFVGLSVTLLGYRALQTYGA